MKPTYTQSIAAILGLFLLSTQAQSSLLGGTVSNLSGTRNVSYSEASTVFLRWSMQRDDSAGGAGLTVTSGSGTFTNAAGDIVLGQVNRTLSKSLPSSGGIDTFTFNETVRIPRDVLFQAYKYNLRQVFYERQFTDCPAAQCSTITLNTSYTLAGSSASTFGITEFSLRFADGSLSALVLPQEKLHAGIRLKVSGTGTIKGLWEVATPTTTGGTPFYRSLQLVTRQVSSGHTTQLYSPPLPTDQAGNYLVRFRLLEPELGEQPPALQYIVTQPLDAPVVRFDADIPPDGMPIDTATRFGWQPVDGASGYRLEIAIREPRNAAHEVTAVTGIMVRDKTSASLTSSLMQRLEAGNVYWWHVLAIDDAGRVIGETEWRRMRVR